MTRKPLGVQLWTLRKEMAADMAGTLARVADIGYKGIELWFQTWPAADELEAVTADCGLRIISAHVPFEQLRDDFDAVAEYHRQLGNGDLVIPNIPPHLREGEDDWRARIDEIGGIAQACKNSGFRLSYHNHAIEFEDKIDGREVHDCIFASHRPELLKAQLDTYFIEEVGKDPADYIRRYADRLPLLHIKDKTKPPAEHINTEIGSGTINWDAVFAAAGETNVEWYIVEQNCETCPALKSLEISYGYLHERGVV